MRLFIAIELAEQIKDRLSGLRTDIPGTRWVRTDQLHLTLAFLGEVDEDRCTALVTELGKIRSPGFTLHFNRLGCFPHPRQPRVLWAGLDPEPLLLQLARQIQRSVRECGIHQEEQPFTPHITLARCRQPVAREVGKFFGQHPHLQLPVLEVQEFYLFQSQLTVSGAVHTPLKQFSLPASAEH